MKRNELLSLAKDVLENQVERSELSAAKFAQEVAEDGALPREEGGLMDNPYEKMTQQEFDEILWEKVGNDYSHVPGAYEVFSEYYNNDVLDEWLSSQPDEEE